MVDASDTILYVGKAKNLKKRINSYFVVKHKEVKTIFLVSKISRIEIVVTQNEYEALVLENKLIKTLRPKYNIALKDDKTYPYVMIPNDEPFPKISIVRKKMKANATYFGPYAAIGPTRKLLRMLGDLFPLRDCKQLISLTRKEPKCINLDIGRCIGPCIKKEIKPEYDKVIDDLKLFLQGKNRQLIQNLKKEMKELAETKAFEKAARVRDQIQKIEVLCANRMVLPEESANMQLWSIAEEGPVSYILVQTVVAGTLLYQKGFYEANLSPQEKNIWIQTIYINLEDEDSKSILCEESLLESLKSCVPATIALLNPKRGDKKDLLVLTQKNAKIALNRLLLKKQEANPEVLEEMKAVLNLDHLPTDIVGIDISHLQGTHIVASAVYFKNGKPESSEYRRFHIRSVSEKSNDPKSIYEVVSRRLNHKPLPTLLLIDGGKGQLSFARRALEEHGLENDIDIISLAKKDEEVYSPKHANKIKLEKRSPVLRLLQHVRDESHRFALAFHRNRRGSELKNTIERKKKL